MSNRPHLRPVAGYDFEKFQRSRHRGADGIVRNPWGRAGAPRPVPYDIDAIGELIERDTDGGRRRRMPRTVAEWQYAADLAELCLSLDAARQFGLVTGGPTFNLDRIDWLLEQAEARHGITPAPSDELLGRFIAELQAEAADG